MASGTETLLAVEGLTKDFGGQRALDSVDFDLRSGEIHALLGENGAGKSTLIKILAGVQEADGGTVTVGGRPLPGGFGHAEHARRTGLHFVHQDLGLIDELSVAENIALETGYATRGPLIDHRATRRRAAKMLAEVNSAIRPDALVRELAQAERVMVAVARAFAGNANVIVLDEVTASLPGPEAAQLADALRAAKRKGTGLVFVTHRIAEVFGLCDRVTVLRDGKRVQTVAVGEVGHEQIVEWIVGQKLEDKDFKHEDHPGGEDAEEHALVVDGLSGPGLEAPASFKVRPGEVVGITGLIGSGANALGRLLGGAASAYSGSAHLDGEVLPLGDTAALWERGFAYVPGDRQREGGFPGLTVRENLFPGRIKRAGDSRTIWPPTERRTAGGLAERFRVQPRGALERPLATLSGGNQQKVVFGRAMRSKPKLLVLDDPTAGVDVGSRVELYALLRDSVEAGTAVVLVSSDFDEIARLADRALVMRQGRLAAELSREAMTRERLAVESYKAEDSGVGSTKEEVAA